MNRPLLKAYLAIYFGLIIGAIVTMQRAGVLSHIPSRTRVIAVIFVIGLGILAAITGGQRRAPGK
jgi:hypothetical protein